MEKKAILCLLLLSSFILFTSSKNLKAFNEEDLRSQAALVERNEAQLVAKAGGSIKERTLSVVVDDYGPTGPNTRHRPRPPHPYAP